MSAAAASGGGPLPARTQVGIVGAGPAGLLCSHLLQRLGIDSVVLESRSMLHTSQRLRAGVLEHGAVQFLASVGLGERMHRIGMPMEGMAFHFGGQAREVRFGEETGGRIAMVYPQHELVADLLAARTEAHGPIRFETPVLRVADPASQRPRIVYQHGGAEHELACDFVVGADGFRGVCREAIPADVLKVHRHDYPFSWLGILANAPPARRDMTTWGHHRNGFAMLSMRSPAISRLYLQCPPDDAVEGWSDDRIWQQLHERLEVGNGLKVNEGPITQKTLTRMRSVMVEPMQYGRLFLAGDAAHIVPPTGAKGLNSAIADIRVLASGLRDHYRHGDSARLERYSRTCLARMWLVQRFSSRLCTMAHTFPDADELMLRLQVAEFDHMTGSPTGRRDFAACLTGLPVDD